MDSFPCLIKPYPPNKPSLEPSVPDVSLLMNPLTTNSYRSWKNNILNEEAWNKKASVTKKQVRFNNLNASDNCIGRIQTDEYNSELKKIHTDSGQSDNSTPSLNKIFKNKQFQEIYMANIPNRHLDLSLIDIVTPVDKSAESVNVKQSHFEQIVSDETKDPIDQRVPTTYKEFLEMQRCEIGDVNPNKLIINKSAYVTDIYNYTSPKHSPTSDYPIEKKNKLKCVEQMKYPSLLTNKTDKDPFIRSGSILNSNRTHSVLKKHFEQKSSPHQEFKRRQVEIVQNLYGEHSRDDCSNMIEAEFGAKINLKKCDSAVQTSITSQSDKNKSNEKMSSTCSEKNDDPTVKDLLKIIHQQNEQLLILQKQVASLLDCRDYPKQIEAPPQLINVAQDEFIPKGEQKDFVGNSGSTPRKGPLPKFSIDLMTSFEVSFRPQQNLYHKKQRDLLFHEPKIQEIIETESNDYNRESSKKFADSSLQLQDPISVQENCPSPEPSIKIDMKDYETSDEEEDDITSSIGSTFYKNLMDQVNKVIQNAHKQTNGDRRPSKTEELRGKTLSVVRDATIKHLRKIGMNFSTIDEVTTPSCSTESDNNTSEQISFAVKQLLMKYLPDDHLAKLTPGSNEYISRKEIGDKIILNSRAPEFSFATVQFMKKYNLIASDGDYIPRKYKVPANSKSTKMHKRSEDTNPKILDISSLKQQPKLL